MGKGDTRRPSDVTPQQYGANHAMTFDPRYVRLEHSTVVLCGHHPDACAGEYCTLHNRSAHHMRAWPQHWRADRGMMERICPHGVGHPDPDELPHVDRVHGCDGCCDPAREETAGRGDA